MIGVADAGAGSSPIRAGAWPILKATRTLATVRRLLVPAVQVNIGRNQVIAQGLRDDGTAS